MYRFVAIFGRLRTRSDFLLLKTAYWENYLHPSPVRQRIETQNRSTENIVPLTLGLYSRVPVVCAHQRDADKDICACRRNLCVLICYGRRFTLMQLKKTRLLPSIK